MLIVDSREAPDTLLLAVAEATRGGVPAEAAEAPATGPAAASLRKLHS